MNWNAISAISELIGTLAIVISLIYLAAQVRQSNLNSQEQTRQRMMELANAHLSIVINHPEINRAWVEPEISKEDSIKLAAWLTTAMRAREYEWFSYKNGAIDKDMFETYSGVITYLLGTKRARNYWAIHGNMNEFHPDFVEYVNNLIKDAPYMDHIFKADQTL